MKQTAKIILLCMTAAIFYGIVHNQVTVRISLEYFTIGHRALISSTSPTLMGIAWGVHPNWWVGMSMGIILAAAARLGKWPKRDVRSLIKPLLILFLISGMASATAGILGYRLANSGTLGLYGPLASSVPASGHAAYISALWMHTASYTVGTMGALILSLLVFTGRIRSASE
ncbi:MAG: hypothetical protein KAH31_05525 [Candidatus Sabulitectum sp.]|nr:hypothetical protein [Candidatus Sabulitectum sp.]